MNNQNKQNKDKTIETINSSNFSFKKIFNKASNNKNKNTQKLVNNFDLNMDDNNKLFNSILSDYKVKNNNYENKFNDKELERLRLEKVKAKMLGYDIINNKRLIKKGTLKNNNNLSIDFWLSRIDYASPSGKKSLNNPHDLNFINEKVKETSDIIKYQNELNLNKYYEYTKEKTFERNIRINKGHYSMNYLNDNVINKKEYVIPPISLLNDWKSSTEDLFYLNLNIAKKNMKKITNFFEKNGLNVKLISFDINGINTLFNVELENLKLDDLSKIQKDLQFFIKNDDILIVPSKFNKNNVIIEIINKNIQKIYFKDLFIRVENKQNYKLPLFIGNDMKNNPFVMDLIDYPNILVVGKKESGKTLLLHVIIMSLIMTMSSDNVKFLLMDFKKIEFSKYQDFSYLITPIINDARKGLLSLNRVISLIEDRYEKLRKAKYNNIQEYNEENEKKIPFLVIIIDELFHLINFSSVNIKKILNKIIELGPKVGIYSILATKYMDDKILDSKLKNNIQNKIVFYLEKKEQLMKVLNLEGAIKLTKYADMLIYLNNSKNFNRVQLSHIFPKDVNNVLEFLKSKIINKDKQIIDNSSIVVRKEEIILLDLTDNLIIDTIKFLCRKKIFHWDQIKEYLKIDDQLIKRIFYTLEEYNFFEEDEYGNKYLSNKMFGELCELSNN